MEQLRVYDGEAIAKVAKIFTTPAELVTAASSITTNTIDINTSGTNATYHPAQTLAVPPSAVTKSNANSENAPTSSVAASYIGKVLTSEERAFLLKDASRIPNINLVAMLIVFLPYLTYLLNEG